MGTGGWKTTTYEARVAAKAASGTPTFDHDAYVKTTGQWVVHPSLDPRGKNTQGRQIRESRDSAEHPNSVPIAVFFDVTGSMGEIPVTLQKKLPQLYGLLLRKGYVTDPQVLYGAFGDANCDKVPLQVGQFESDNRADVNLESFVLEGGGGGHRKETSELAMFFMARFAELDCLKQGRKGYLFLISDEMAYPEVSRRHVKGVMDVDIEADIPLAATLKELQTKFEVFFLMAPSDSYGQYDQIFAFWRDLLGERAIKLEDPEAVCETIALTIGMCEGAIDLEEGGQHLLELGVDSQLVEGVSRSLQPVGAAVSSSAVASSNAPLPAMDDDGGDATQRP